MSGNQSVAFVTCSAYPDGYFDDVMVVKPLAAAGVDVTFVTWDDPDVDWTVFDLVVLRSTWDYTQRLDQFLAWAASVRNLANALPIVTWNTDKRYLGQLAAAGAPVVPTAFIEPGIVEPGNAEHALGAAIGEISVTSGEFVLKPSVGAGSVDAGRYRSDDPDAAAAAAKHVGSLLETGRTVMVQPYLDAIDVHGETALIFLNGEFCHAIRKEAMLSGGPTEIEGLFGDERTSPTEASPAHFEAAEAILNAVPFDRADLLYARVDLLPSPDGPPVLLELELVEPSLFMGDSPGTPERFAAAIIERLERRSAP